MNPTTSSMREPNTAIISKIGTTELISADAPRCQMDTRSLAIGLLRQLLCLLLSHLSSHTVTRRINLSKFVDSKPKINDVKNSVSVVCFESSWSVACRNGYAMNLNIDGWSIILRQDEWILQPFWCDRHPVTFAWTCGCITTSVNFFSAQSKDSSALIFRYQKKNWLHGGKSKERSEINSERLTRTKNNHTFPVSLFQSSSYHINAFPVEEKTILVEHVGKKECIEKHSV